MEATTEEYYPDVTDDYRIELIPKGKYAVKCYSMMQEERNPKTGLPRIEGSERLKKWKFSKVFYPWKDYTMGFLPERTSEGEEIPFNLGEKISNRARRWREAKQAKQKILLKNNEYRIGVPPTNKYLNRYPGEKTPLEWKQPKKDKEEPKRGIITTTDKKVQIKWIGQEEHRKMINYKKILELWRVPDIMGTANLKINQLPDNRIINPTVNCFVVSYETNRRTTRGRKRSKVAVEVRVTPYRQVGPPILPKGVNRPRVYSLTVGRGQERRVNDIHRGRGQTMQYPKEDQAELVWIENIEEVLREATQGVVQAHQTDRFGPSRVERKGDFDIESAWRELMVRGSTTRRERITVSEGADSTSKGRDSEPEGDSTSKGRDRIGGSADVQHVGINSS
ncbi:hypothetical protein R1sor_003801 [Riccia sorocarpa]|uniref:Uncharacterized protein n=1 Tax=Riccia sorocarpa TaxID=122646 RepID=A0ABD3H6L2_9MARC